MPGDLRPGLALVGAGVHRAVARTEIEPGRIAHVVRGEGVAEHGREEFVLRQTC